MSKSLIRSSQSGFDGIFDISLLLAETQERRSATRDLAVRQRLGEVRLTLRRSPMLLDAESWRDVAILSQVPRVFTSCIIVENFPGARTPVVLLRHTPCKRSF